MEALAGQKEGCHDDMEFIKVPRPATCPAPAVSMDEGQEALPAGGLPAGALVDSSTHLASLDETPLALGHPAEVAMKWVQVGAAAAGSLMHIGAVGTGRCTYCTRYCVCTQCRFRHGSVLLYPDTPAAQAAASCLLSAAPPCSPASSLRS